ncbi:MAG: arginase family protein [Promethearchaeota archaeon]
MKYPEWSDLQKTLLRGRNVPMIEADTPSFMGQPHAISQDDLQGADVVIIGAPYVASWGPYSGVSKEEWIAAPKRVRQQSVKYVDGYIQEFDLDVFEHLRLVDFGDALIPSDVYDKPTVGNILAAQSAVEMKVNQTLNSGAIPIVIGQNSPCGSYAIAKPIAEKTGGNVGVISLDTHWDNQPLDRLTMDPRIAGSGSWKAKMYEFHENMHEKNLVEIGERGMSGGRKEDIREFLSRGTHFYPMWQVRKKGIEWLCGELHHAYNGTEATYVHFDMDVLGGAGPAPGDLLGTLAEPLGMTDYEVLRLSYEIGKRGFNALSFICIPPGSAVMYRLITYVIMYMLAGKIVAVK